MDQTNPISIFPSNTGKILKEYFNAQGITGYCPDFPDSLQIPSDRLFDGSQACIIDLPLTIIHPQLGTVNQIFNYDPYLEVFNNGADVCSELLRSISQVDSQFCQSYVLDNSLQVFMNDGMVKLPTSSGDVLEMPLSEFIKHVNAAVDIVMTSDLKGFVAYMYNQIVQSNIPTMFIILGILASIITVLEYKQEEKNDRYNFDSLC